MRTLTFYRPNTIENIMNEFNSSLGSLDSLLTPAARVFNHVPVVDVRETDEAYILDMELPGYDEKNIEVNVDGTKLTISSNHEEKEEKKAEGEQTTYLIKERRTSSFSRSFKLPSNADPDVIKAAFKNGILNLEIKKRPEAQRRVIAINAA